MPKTILRQSLDRQRRQLDDSARKLLDDAAQLRFLSSATYATADVIALYAPCRGEVDTSQLFAAARATGKHVVYPRVADDHLVFVTVKDPRSLQAGAFGILEPIGCDEVSVAKIDVMIVPGLAFSRDGHRLGSGFGYYDRTFGLRGRPGKLIGFAYDFQLQDTLPIEPHDVQLDLLITDARTLVFDVSPGIENPIQQMEGGVNP